MNIFKAHKGASKTALICAFSFNYFKDTNH